MLNAFLKQTLLISSWVLMSTQPALAETHSAQEWGRIFDQAQQKTQQRLTQVIQDLNTVSAQKIKSLAQQFLTAGEPVLVVIKSASLHTEWSSADTSLEFLSESLTNAVKGTGFALVSMGTRNGVPHYFIIGDQMPDLAAATFDSLKCADLLDSYMNILKSKNAMIRDMISHKSTLTDHEYQKIIQEIYEPAFALGDQVCFQK